MAYSVSLDHWNRLPRGTCNSIDFIVLLWYLNRYHDLHDRMELALKTNFKLPWKTARWKDSLLDIVATHLRLTWRKSRNSGRTVNLCSLGMSDYGSSYLHPVDDKLILSFLVVRIYFLLRLLKALLMNHLIVSWYPLDVFFMVPPSCL